MNKPYLQIIAKTLGLPFFTRDATTRKSQLKVGDDIQRLSAGLPTPITAAFATTAAMDGEEFVNLTNTARTITVDPDMPAGFGFSVWQKGTGAVTVQAGSGVTVTGVGGFVKTSGAGAQIVVKQVSANLYMLSGAGAT